MPIIIVSGALANKYRNGGAAWTRMSWVLGFKKLGFEVYFVEQIAPENCVDAAGNKTRFERSANLAYFEQITKAFGIADSSALIESGNLQSRGLALAQLLEIADAAELLVNISGHLTLEPLLQKIRRKAYIDLDPGFTQFWHVDPSINFHLQPHDFYFTVGENIGTDHCTIPTDDIRWRPIRQPVVLEHWPMMKSQALSRFTTIASWRGPFGPVQHRNKSFGLKVHEFRKFIELPAGLEQNFEMALHIHPADHKDLDALKLNGWRIVDPALTVANPATFRSYVQNSDAEFSVAQGIYVETNSGWFSDRTVRYLASGKPALVQDTGFSRNLPVGVGLLAFST
ncbi:MAG: glycosyltransferase, partial [bacterium]